MEVTKEIETRSKAAADILNARMEQFSHDQDQHQRGRTLDRAAHLIHVELISARMEQLSNAIKTNTGEAERAIGTLTTSTATSIGNMTTTTGPRSARSRPRPRR